MYGLLSKWGTMTTAAAGDTDLSVRGTYLRTCILLLLTEGPAHGYEILSELSARGLGNVDAGGLYRALRAMEDEGLVISHWEHEHPGPARRVYAITEEGEDWLPTGADAARDMRRRLSRLLHHYSGLVGGRETSLP